MLVMPVGAEHQELILVQKVRSRGGVRPNEYRKVKLADVCFGTLKQPREMAEVVGSSATIAGLGSPKPPAGGHPSPNAPLTAAGSPAHTRTPPTSHRPSSPSTKEVQFECPRCKARYSMNVAQSPGSKHYKIQCSKCASQFSVEIH